MQSFNPKKAKKKTDKMSQMMMMMSMMAQGEPEKDPVEEQLLQMVEKQNQLLEKLSNTKQNSTHANKALLDRIHKLEMKLDQAEDEDTRNPVMDLFFLQNMMMSQNSVNNHFDPESDGKSKQLQSFLMAQMLGQMNAAKAVGMANQAEPDAGKKKKKKDESSSEDSGSDESDG